MPETGPASDKQGPDPGKIHDTLQTVSDSSTLSRNAGTRPEEAEKFSVSAMQDLSGKFLTNVVDVC